ncbi:hypothetical protein [Treponema socranskii]|uniref:hypothetical protein n=1 Tax=Treponema socranskii TaxID=53419 RepID=UPI003D8E78F5
MGLFDSLERKRILIQDVSDLIELQRFFGHNIYKRKDPPPSKDKTKDKTETNIDIDFFAPYFTLPAKEEMGKNGIYCYAPVLLFFRDTGGNTKKLFAKRRKALEEMFGSALVMKWEYGLCLDEEERETEKTYYFLGEPIWLSEPIVKVSPKAAGKQAHAMKIKKQIGPNLIRHMSDFCKDVVQSGKR